jgi:hypothetical protein
MTQPLYIFDLDGTLADLHHRRHFVERPSTKCYDCGGANRRNCAQCSDLDAGFKPNWSAFHAACVYDAPIKPVIELLKNLALGSGERGQPEIWLWSGRMDTVHNETIQWLEQYDVLHLLDGIKMRPAGNYTIDHELKQQWFYSMSPEDRARLVCVFDDRNQVVDMWRRNGVLCCQVAPGDF